LARCIRENKKWKGIENIMKTYLVTGGAGFIGSNYIHYMFKKYGSDIKIINVDALTYAGNPENLKGIENRDNYKFIKADICDKEAISKIFETNDIDRVVHFAAESHVDRSIRNPEVFVQTNVLGTAVMLNCAKSAWELEDGSFKPDKKFLHVSTDEVYGSLEEEGEYFYETTPYDPHSPYSASKASSDMLVKAYMDTYHFPANITNCSNNYGPYQFPEKLIPLIINNALQGKKLPVYGDGKNVRDWLYVEDHAKAIDMVQEKGRLFETYNVGGHNEKQNIEIINIIIETLQEMLPENDPRKKLVSKDLITYVEDRKGHDRRYAIAPDKIKAEIGWEPETMFKEGIRLTIQWFFENEEWMKNVTSGEYQKYYTDMYSTGQLAK
jgi:dTDP-glucose 4,6-dehydratase